MWFTWGHIYFLTQIKYTMCNGLYAVFTWIVKKKLDGPNISRHNSLADDLDFTCDDIALPVVTDASQWVTPLYRPSLHHLDFILWSDPLSLFLVAVFGLYVQASALTPPLSVLSFLSPLSHLISLTALLLFHPSETSQDVVLHPSWDEESASLSLFQSAEKSVCGKGARVCVHSAPELKQVVFPVC